MLDGEIVAFDEQGRPSFSSLQQRMQLSSARAGAPPDEEAPVTYVLFDLLWLDGHSLMGLPYSERRELLDVAAALGGEPGRRPSTSSATARRC